MPLLLIPSQQGYNRGKEYTSATSFPGSATDSNLLCLQHRCRPHGTLGLILLISLSMEVHHFRCRPRLPRTWVREHRQLFFQKWSLHFNLSFKRTVMLLQESSISFNALSTTRGRHTHEMYTCSRRLLFTGVSTSGQVIECCITCFMMMLQWWRSRALIFQK